MSQAQHDPSASRPAAALVPSREGIDSFFNLVDDVVRAQCRFAVSAVQLWTGGVGGKSPEPTSEPESTISADGPETPTSADAHGSPTPAGAPGVHPPARGAGRT